MTEKILVPLDGSKVGEAALELVRNVITKYAPEIKVEVTLLQVITSITHHVVGDNGSVVMEYSPEVIAGMKKAAIDYLRKAGEPLAKSGVALAYKVATGNPAEKILMEAAEIGVAFIAMSTHGRSGITRWALGSVTDRVLHGATQPVLVVRAAK